MNTHASGYVVDETNERQLLMWLDAGSWTREEATFLLQEIHPLSFTSECFSTFSGTGEVQYDYFDDYGEHRVPCGENQYGEIEYLTSEQDALFYETKRRCFEIDLKLKPQDAAAPHEWVELACKKGITIPWLAWANSRGLFVQDEVADEGLSDPVGEGAVAQDTQWHLLATPEQLITAFGTFTGMSESWFDSVKDKPKLFAARHIAGVGGRGGSEPLYKTFEVMKWLMRPKSRVVGWKPLTEETAWRLLKRHFPAVYEHYEVIAPDTD